ncbi:hypothetical protein HDU67_006358 [Dinochytrium kinnereticum]|nr:hypothetical protein HDU67_006358 [Dinochytrium kinnereticum]
MTGRFSRQESPPLPDDDSDGSDGKDEDDEKRMRKWIGLIYRRKNPLAVKELLQLAKYFGGNKYLEPVCDPSVEVDHIISFQVMELFLNLEFTQTTTDQLAVMCSKYYHRMKKHSDAYITRVIQYHEFARASTAHSNDRDDWVYIRKEHVIQFLNHLVAEASSKAASMPLSVAALNDIKRALIDYSNLIRIIKPDLPDFSKSKTLKHAILKIAMDNRTSTDEQGEADRANAVNNPPTEAEKTILTEAPSEVVVLEAFEDAFPTLMNDTEVDDMEGVQYTPLTVRTHQEYLHMEQVVEQARHNNLEAKRENAQILEHVEMMKVCIQQIEMADKRHKLLLEEKASLNALFESVKKRNQEISQTVERQFRELLPEINKTKETDRTEGSSGSSLAHPPSTLPGCG